MGTANTLHRLKEYIDNKGISVRAFEQSVNMSNGSFASQLKNNKTIGVDKLEYILYVYHDINAEWLLTGQGEMLKHDCRYDTKEKHITSYSNVDFKPCKEHVINDEKTPQSKKIKIVSEAVMKYENEKNNGLITIPIVEIYAAAGYGYMNTDNLIPTGEINLPRAMFRSNGLRYCIRIKGFSMAPTLQDSDYLIIRHLDVSEWQKMPDEHVFLVVDKDGMAYVKRVKNRLNRGFIVLMSDSIEKSSYPNFNLQGDEIANIFYAEWHFSAKMQNINETYYDRLKTLEDRFEDLENKFKHR